MLAPICCCDEQPGSLPTGHRTLRQEWPSWNRWRLWSESSIKLWAEKLIWHSNTDSRTLACKRFDALYPVIKELESSAAIINVPANKITFCLPFKSEINKYVVHSHFLFLIMLFLVLRETKSLGRSLMSGESSCEKGVLWHAFLTYRYIRMMTAQIIYSTSATYGAVEYSDGPTTIPSGFQSIPLQHTVTGPGWVFKIIGRMSLFLKWSRRLLESCELTGGKLLNRKKSEVEW
jgi:hypothetical protein